MSVTDIDPPVTVPGELHAIHQRLDAGDRRMQAIERDLKLNTEATEAVRANTAELLDAFAALQGAFKVLGWIGKAAKPLGWLAATVVAIAGAWSTIKGVK